VSTKDLTSPVILVDLDGVAVNLVDGWKKIWNEKYPDRQITADPTTFLLEDAYSGFGTEKEIAEIIHTPDFFLKLEPMPGAIEAFKQMHDSGLELYICSAPTSLSCSYSEKIDWVEMHLGRDWTKRVILTKDKTLVQGDYLIDDNPAVVGAFDPSWEHILFDASYNRSEQDKRFRITWKNWPSLLLYHAG
jgi:5'-nucleotidase